MCSLSGSEHEHGEIACGGVEGRAVSNNCHSHYFASVSADQPRSKMPDLTRLQAEVHDGAKDTEFKDVKCM